MKPHCFGGGLIHPKIGLLATLIFSPVAALSQVSIDQSCDIMHIYQDGERVDGLTGSVSAINAVEKLINYRQDGDFVVDLGECRVSIRGNSGQAEIPDDPIDVPPEDPPSEAPSSFAWSSESITQFDISHYLIKFPNRIVQIGASGEYEIPWYISLGDSTLDFISDLGSGGSVVVDFIRGSFGLDNVGLDAEFLVSAVTVDGEESQDMICTFSGCSSTSQACRSNIRGCMDRPRITTPMPVVLLDGEEYFSGTIDWGLPEMSYVRPTIGSHSRLTERRDGVHHVWNVELACRLGDSAQFVAHFIPRGETWAERQVIDYGTKTEPFVWEIELEEPGTYQAFSPKCYNGDVYSINYEGVPSITVRLRGEE